MKKTYKLLAIFIAVFALSGFVKAQTWNDPEPEGVVFTSGTGYYVYNIGAKAFLDRGGQWATQAIVFPEKGSLITPVQSGALWVLQYESSTRTLFPSDVADGWTYTDNTTSNTWDIQVTEPLNNIYSIQINNTYGGYNSSQYLGASATLYTSNSGVVQDVRYNRTASDYTKWKFCTPDAVEKYNAQVKLDKFMKIARLTGSSIDLAPYITIYNTGTAIDILAAAATLNSALAPQDKTSSLTNAAFDANPSTGWTATAGYGYNFQEVEYYGRSFDIYQNVTGLPAGIYILKAQGFERPSGLSVDMQTWHNNGWDARSAKLYATVTGTTTTTPVRSIYSESTSPTGNLINGITYPNSMSNAYDAITTNGLYDNELTYFTVDATGTARIGIIGSNLSNGNYTMSQWVLMDNFRLYYYGALAIPNITVSVNSLLISNAISNTKTFDVTGSNLVGDITITAPAGLTLTGASLVNNGGGVYTIAQVNANKTNTITVTWDEENNLSTTITVSSPGVSTHNISVNTSKDNGCFTALYADRPNLVSDPYITSLSNFAGWGTKVLVTDPSEVYCGAASAKVGDGTTGGSLDYGLTGIIQPEKTYRVKAMVKTEGGEFQLGVFGWSNGQGDINNVINTNGAWQELVFNFTTGAALGGSQGMFWNNYQKSGLIGYIDNWEMYDVTDIVSSVNNTKTNEMKVFVQNNTIIADINAQAAANAEITVYNLQGSRLYTENMNCISGFNRLVIEKQLSSGVYMVQLNVNGEITTSKIVK